MTMALADDDDDFAIKMSMATAKLIRMMMIVLIMITTAMLRLKWAEEYAAGMAGWVLLYVHRNRRLIRDGSPGRPPRLSHSSWAAGIKPGSFLDDHALISDDSLLHVNG